MKLLLLLGLGLVSSAWGGDAYHVTTNGSYIKSTFSLTDIVDSLKELRSFVADLDNATTTSASSYLSGAEKTYVKALIEAKKEEIKDVINSFCDAVPCEHGLFSMKESQQQRPLKRSVMLQQSETKHFLGDFISILSNSRMDQQTHTLNISLNLLLETNRNIDLLEKYTKGKIETVYEFLTIKVIIDQSLKRISSNVDLVRDIVRYGESNRAHPRLFPENKIRNMMLDYSLRTAMTTIDSTSLEQVWYIPEITQENKFDRYSIKNDQIRLYQNQNSNTFVDMTLNRFMDCASVNTSKKICILRPCKMLSENSEVFCQNLDIQNSYLIMVSPERLPYTVQIRCGNTESQTIRLEDQSSLLELQEHCAASSTSFLIDQTKQTRSEAVKIDDGSKVLSLTFLLSNEKQSTNNITDRTKDLIVAIQENIRRRDVSRSPTTRNPFESPVFQYVVDMILFLLIIVIVILFARRFYR